MLFLFDLINVWTHLHIRYSIIMKFESRTMFKTGFYALPLILRKYRERRLTDIYVFNGD